MTRHVERFDIGRRFGHDWQVEAETWEFAGETEGQFLILTDGYDGTWYVVHDERTGEFVVAVIGGSYANPMEHEYEETYRSPMEAMRAAARIQRELADDEQAYWESVAEDRQAY